MAASTASLENIKSFDRLNQRRWAVRNVYGVSISMVMVFTAFVGLQNLQSTINSDGGLGLISLSVLYGVFVVIGPLTPIILRRLGTKYSLLVGFVCHLLYTIANFFPSWYTLIPGSILIGLASGPIWAAAGSHLAEIAITAAVSLKKEQTYLISKYMAVFFFIFPFSQLPGNIASSLILFPYTTSNNSNFINAMGSPTVTTQAVSNLSSTDMCNYFDEKKFEKNGLFYILVSLYCAFILAGIAILLLAVDRIKMMRYYAGREKSDSLWMKLYLHLPLLEILSVFRSWKMVLLSPMALYTGLEMGFTYGTFTRVYISECFGAHQVGFALMILGASSGLMSFVCSKLIKWVPRFSIILIGAAVHFIIFFGLALWKREPSYLVVYGGAILWGCGNAVWNTIGTSLTGILFPQRLESAYSVLRMWLALGFTLSYATANMLTVTVRASLLIVILLFSIACLFIIEWVIKQPCCPYITRKKKSRVGDKMFTQRERSRSAETGTPSYGSALFEACGGIVLSDISLSWVYQVDGNVAEERSASSSSSQSASNNAVTEHPSHINVNTETNNNKHSDKPAIRRAPSPTYSHKSEIFERHSSMQSAITTRSSAPMFSQYTGTTLSSLSPSFVSTVIAANQPPSENSESNDSVNTLFEAYTGEGLTNMSSTFLHTGEGDGTLSDISSNSVFQECKNESIIDLSTFLLSSKEEGNDNQVEAVEPEPQELYNFACDSIDGTEPQPKTYSFSHYLRTRHSRYTNAARVDQSHSGQVRATSAPANSSRKFQAYEKNTHRTTDATTKDQSENAHKPTANLGMSRYDSKYSKPSASTSKQSENETKLKRSGEQDSRSRSNIIFIGPPHTQQDSDSDEESVWTSVSLSHYTV